MSAAATLLGLPEPSRPADAVLAARFRRILAAADPDTDVTPVPPAEEIVPALVEVVPDALARHRRERIPEHITRASLLDVGRKHRLYGAASVLSWLLGILRGDVVEVGRLQVERRAGPHGHALHIPETGPLDPPAVDRSLRSATALTNAHTFSCTSWLLEPVLREELPGSNIAAFASRFRIVSTPEPDDAASEAVCKFVFRRPLREVLDPRLVTPRSRLEVVVAGRLRAGIPWSEPTGTLVV